MAIADAGRRLVARGGTSTLAGTAVLVGAAAVTLADGPVWLRTAAWLLAALAVGSAAARLRRSAPSGSGRLGADDRPGVDPLLVALTVVVVAAVASGFVLEAAGAPLGRGPWAVLLAVVGIAVLVVARAQRPASPATAASPTEGASPAPRRRSAVALAAAGPALAIAVVVASFVVAVDGADDADVPPVALSVTDLQPTSVDVVVRAPGDAGPYEVRTDGGVASTLSYPPVTVTDGEPTSTTVLLPPEGKVIVTLHNLGQAEPLRSVVIDR